MFRSVPPGLWVIGLRMRLSNAKWEVPMPVMDAGRPAPSPAVVTIRSRAKYSQVGFDYWVDNFEEVTIDSDHLTENLTPYRVERRLSWRGRRSRRPGGVTSRPRLSGKLTT